MKYLIQVLFIFLLVSCSSYDETASGLIYQLFPSGKVEKPENGEYMIMNILIENQNDSLIFDSNIVGMPVHYRYDEYSLKLSKKTQLEEGIFMLNKGDSGVFKIKPDELFFMKLPVEQMNGLLICYVKLINILDYQAYSEWKEIKLKERNARSMELIGKQLEMENRLIDSLLRLDGIEYQVSDGGIRYVMNQSGSGRSPSNGEVVLFTYRVTYLDGTLLPNDLGTSGDKSKSFVIGSSGVFESWQESLMLLKAGGAGTFYYPSTMAFGNMDSYGIKPNSILKAYIQLQKVE